MSESFKFENLENHFITMLTLITQNQNIKRYLKYLSDTPLEVNNEQPDIDEPLLDINIMPYLYSSECLVEEKAMMFFSPYVGNLGNKPAGIEEYVVDILIPNDYWTFHGHGGKMRAVRIASEIAKMLDGQYSENLGIKEVQISDFRFFNVADKKYRGLNFSINLVVSTMGVRT